MKNRMVIKIIYLIIFYLVCISPFSKAVVANAMSLTDNMIETDMQYEIYIETDEIQLSVRYGMEQLARYGRNLLISTELNSKSLTGIFTLNICFGDSKNENSKYGKEVILNENEIVTTNLTIPIIKEVTSIKIELLDDKGETVVEEVKSFHVMNFGTYKLVGILSDMSSDLSYFNAFGSKCYYMNKSSFPSEKAGLDMLDIIIVNNFDCNQLSESQLDALIEYISGGGTIVIGTGQTLTDSMSVLYERGLFKIKDIKSSEELLSIPTKRQNITITNTETFPKLLEFINNYENNRISILSRMEERKASVNIKKEDSYVYVGDSMIQGTLLSELKISTIQKNIALFRVEQSSNILVENGNVLIQKYKYNNGNILFASFDLGMETDEKEGNLIHTSYIELANIIYNNLGSGYQEKLEIESYGSGNGYESIIQVTDNNDSPRIALFLILLIIYIVLIGPGIFIFLRRFEKNKYMWGIVPFVSLIFVFFVYKAGIKTRVSEPYIGFFTIETYDIDRKQVQGEMTFGLSFPTNKDSNVLLQNVDTATLGNVNYPQYSIYGNAISESGTAYHNMENFNTGVTYHNNEVILEVENKPAFATSYFQTTYTYSKEPMIEGEILLSEYALTGEIKNVSDVDMKESYIYSEGILVPLGMIKRGESIKVDDFPSEYLMSTEMVYYSNVLENMVQRDNNNNIISNTRRKSQAMKTLMEELQGKDDTSYLIILSEQLSNENPLYELSMNKGSYGTNVLLVPLKVVYNDPQRNSTLVPRIDTFMDIVEGDNQYIYNYRYQLTKNIIVDYYLPLDDVVEEFAVSGLFNRTIDNKDTTGISENVYFYNINSQEYDLVFDLKRVKKTGKDILVQRISGEALKNYITESNKLRVKYDSGALVEDITILPNISYRKEMSHAGN